MLRNLRLPYLCSCSSLVLRTPNALPLMSDTSPPQTAAVAPPRYLNNCMDQNSLLYIFSMLDPAETYLPPYATMLYDNVVEPFIYPAFAEYYKQIEITVEHPKETKDEVIATTATIQSAETGSDPSLDEETLPRTQTSETNATVGSDMNQAADLSSESVPETTTESHTAATTSEITSTVTSPTLKSLLSYASNTRTKTVTALVRLPYPLLLGSVCRSWRTASHLLPFWRTQLAWHTLLNPDAHTNRGLDDFYNTFAREPLRLMGPIRRVAFLNVFHVRTVDDVLRSIGQPERVESVNVSSDPGIPDYSLITPAHEKEKRPAFWASRVPAAGSQSARVRGTSGSGAPASSGRASGGKVRPKASLSSSEKRGGRKAEPGTGADSGRHQEKLKRYRENGSSVGEITATSDGGDGIDPLTFAIPQNTLPSSSPPDSVSFLSNNKVPVMTFTIPPNATLPSSPPISFFYLPFSPNTTTETNITTTTKTTTAIPSHTSGKLPTTTFVPNATSSRKIASPRKANGTRSATKLALHPASDPSTYVRPALPPLDDLFSLDVGDAILRSVSHRLPNLRRLVWANNAVKISPKGWSFVARSLSSLDTLVVSRADHRAEDLGRLIADVSAGRAPSDDPIFSLTLLAHPNGSNLYDLSGPAGRYIAALHLPALFSRGLPRAVGDLVGFVALRALSLGYDSRQHELGWHNLRYLLESLPNKGVLERLRIAPRGSARPFVDLRSFFRKTTSLCDVEIGEVESEQEPNVWRGGNGHATVERWGDIIRQLVESGRCATIERLAITGLSGGEPTLDDVVIRSNFPMLQCVKVAWMGKGWWRREGPEKWNFGRKAIEREGEVVLEVNGVEHWVKVLDLEERLNWAGFKAKVACVGMKRLEEWESRGVFKV
ncbi:hypothetical protein BC937DRAFT_91588 [Endogone sp. FLAS-F59071]|nr:hypothetical protein BC937DRAFT_91588 [Endogone sp. FLAS-F59071]|eukprot:RUS16131.1 hypothetical protein BC937DRAFT_91588 [Endogone sp. FLAS-F59071]